MANLSLARRAINGNAIVLASVTNVANGDFLGLPAIQMPKDKRRKDKDLQAAEFAKILGSSWGIMCIGKSWRLPLPLPLQHSAQGRLSKRGCQRNWPGEDVVGAVEEPADDIGGDDNELPEISVPRPPALPLGPTAGMLV